MNFQIVLTLLVAVATIASQSPPETRYGPRIVGGYPINITDMPFQLSLFSKKSFCGAVLISKDFALTAAHCVHNNETYYIGYGSSELPPDNLIEIGSVVVHPNYLTHEHDFDFAVIGLAKALDFSDEVKPVQLPDKGEVAKPGEKMMVSGWGATSEHSFKAEYKLQATNVPILDLTNCQRLYSGFTSLKITPRMICAGLMKGGRDSCQGDSGGPLVRKSDKVLFGLVSWGIGCARPLNPGVYSNVVSVRNWIRNVTGV